MVMRGFNSGRAPGLLRDLAAGLVIQLVAAASTWRLLDLPASYLGVVLAMFGVLALILAWTHPGHEREPGPGLGPANRVTLGRALLVTTVVALAPYAGGAGPGTYWWIILLSTTAMALDGLDGSVARRTGTATPFGARFDMELDAFLLLGLSLLVWASGKVGGWILLVGGMRYLFLAAGWIWPVLTGDLPESGRRKTVCVVQGVALLVCMGPIISSWMASVVGLVGLLALSGSFAVDVRWLLGEGAGEARTGEASADG